MPIFPSMKPLFYAGATRARQFSGNAARLPLLRAVMLGTLFLGHAAAHANTTAQPLPFSQNWSDPDLIISDDDWSGVPGIIGYDGMGITNGAGTPPGVNGTDPQGLLNDPAGQPIKVFADATNPAVTTGGNFEFDSNAFANPTIAFQGAGSAPAPNLVITLNTTGNNTIVVKYNLRDIDNSVSSTTATQKVALQYRVGTSGNYTNVPAAYRANAAGTSAGQATLVTRVNATLPANANNQPVVQLRIMTTNATGSDEMIGVDDINVTGTLTGPPTATDPVITNPLASPNAVEQGQQTLLSVKVTPGTNPTSTGIAVVGNLSVTGGNIAQPFFDDGTNGDVAANDGTYSYRATVAVDATVGTPNIAVRASDDQSRVANASISLTVNARNNAPRLNNMTYTAAVNTPFSAPLAGTDPDGDALTYGLAAGTTLPAGLSLSPAGLISGTPSIPRITRFSVTVNDGKGGTFTGKFAIVVRSISGDAVAPTTTRNAIPASGTRDSYTALTLNGVVQDKAQTGVTPSGVLRVLVQLRSGDNTQAYNGRGAFTTDLTKGYYPATVSAGTAGAARNYSRSLAFMPNLPAGQYILLLYPQDNAGNYTAEYISFNVTAPASAASKAALKAVPKATADGSGGNS